MIKFDNAKGIKQVITKTLYIYLIIIRIKQLGGVKQNAQPPNTINYGFDDN